MIKELIAKLIGASIGECIQEGHRMVYSHTVKGTGYNFDKYTLHFKCSRCGFKANRLATEREKQAVVTIQKAEYRSNQNE